MSELHLSRFYRAPRALVWECWTDPAHVGQWWGPRGFTLTHHSKDLKAGGSWVYTMHGPDGVDYPNTTRYLEVIEGEKLVYDHGSDGQSKPLFRVTVFFRDVDGGTQMDMTMGFENEEVARTTAHFIRLAGGNATWDRLAEYLEKQTDGSDSFVIARSFEASPEVLFEMWTKPEHLAQWLAPAGATIQYLEADIRSGGSAFFRMNLEGSALFAQIDYRELQPPRSLSYTQRFCDARKQSAQHPGLPVFPEKLHTMVLFAPERDDKTRVVVSSRPEGEVSAEQLAAFLKTRDSMTPGWNGSFDKLEAQLGERKKVTAQS